MKNIFNLFMLSAMLVLVSGVVSANEIVGACTAEDTIVGGTIYYDVIENGISGATVEVICSHGGTDYTQYATSLGDGSYSVAFLCNECDYDDDILVNAHKDALTGTEEGVVDMSYPLPCGVTLNVGVVHVPLVPEFGLIAGMATILGALGMVFLVRKK
jgi:hypothetical protein